MKRYIFFIIASIANIAFSINVANTNEIVVQLHDQLNTQVIIPNSFIDMIAALEENSTCVDMHKSMHTNIKSLSIEVPVVRKVSMIAPLNIQSSDGRYVRTTNIYVDVNDVHKHNIKPIMIDSLSITNILVHDLNSLVIALNDSIIDINRQKNKYINNRIADINAIFQPNVTNYLVKTDYLIKNVANANFPQIQSVLMLDNSKFSIDITSNTYETLSQLRQIGIFENAYVNSPNKNEKVKLNDLNTLSHQLYVKWINVLNSNKTSNIAMIKNKKLRKMAGEAWIYNNLYDSATKATMRNNLKFLKTEGYNSILIRFTCTEDKIKLLDMINDIKESGFEVFGTYAGLDGRNPKWNPFIDPDILEEYLAEISPSLTGLFLNWRTTSNHTKILPPEFFNYICNTVRTYNSHILIYGEIYFGRIDPLYTTTMIYTIPKNVTGVVINNMGYYGYNISSVINNMFVHTVPEYHKLDKLGQVIGYGPYYCSRPVFNAYLDIKNEYDYKHSVEKAFRRTGYGTITMIHDGVDDNQTYLVANGNSPCYDTTDNILYDTKLSKYMILQENKQ